MNTEEYFKSITTELNTLKGRVVSGQSKPARDGQMKTSHDENGIASRAVKTAQERDEPTRRELATSNGTLAVKGWSARKIHLDALRFACK